MASGDFLARIKLALEGKQQVVSGLNETAQAAQKLSQTKVTTVFDKSGLATGKQVEETFRAIKPAAEGAASKMGDFERSLRRAAIVAPVWMALRAVMQGTLSIISEGFKTWEEFDRALIKSKAVVHDFSGTTDQAMVVLEDRIRTFSKESGIALADLAASFYRFGTVGIAFEDALSGAIASAKLAKSTLGDVDTISRSLAMSYRLLGDTIDSTLSPMQKQESLAGKIFHLWKTNAFESNEFAQSLNNFVSTANIANFTADETVATLAALGTAGVQGSRGGTLLKTAIQKLVENLDELAPKLGLAVNPELEDTFSLFMRVLGAINKLSQTKGIPTEALKSIQDIFGGTRGGQVISALNALLPELKKNLEDLGKDPQKFIGELNDRFEEVKDTVSGQLDIFRELRKQVGESFVKGIVGAEDFKTSLESVNATMNTMIEIAGGIGEGIRAIVHPILTIKEQIAASEAEQEKFNKYIQDAKDGLLSLEEVINLISMFKVTEETKELIGELQKSAVLLVKQSKLESNLTTWAEKYNSKKTEESDKFEQLNLELQNKLNLDKEGYRILLLQAQRATDLQVAHQNLNNTVGVLVNRYNELTDENGNQVEQISAQVVKSAVLSGNYSKVLDIFKKMGVTSKELTSLADARNKIESTIIQQFIKQDNAIRSQYINYQKADMFERDRLKRLMELQKMTPEQLARAFEGDMFDQAIVEDYWSAFSSEGQNAINDVIQRLYDLPKLDLSAFLGNAKLQNLVPTPTPVLPTNNIIGASIETINVNLPKMDWEWIAAKAGEKVTEELKTNEEFQKLIANGIRNKL